MNEPTNDRDKAREHAKNVSLGRLVKNLDRPIHSDLIIGHDVGFDAGHDHGYASRDGEVAELRRALESIRVFATVKQYDAVMSVAQAALSGKENSDEK